MKIKNNEAGQAPAQQPSSESAAVHPTLQDCASELRKVGDTLEEMTQRVKEFLAKTTSR